MDQIRQIVDEAGWDRASVKIEGERAFHFHRSRDTIGAPADEYEPFCRTLSLRSPEGVIELDQGSQEFVELEKALKHFRLPLYVTLVERGAPAPTGVGSFSLSYQIVDDLCQLEDEWVDAIMSDDTDRIDDVRWRRFRYSAVFERAPCTRETFEMVREANEGGLGGSHLRMMPLAEYYDWYARSSRFIDADGSPTPEALEQAGRMVSAWLALPTPMDAKKIRYWLSRNMEVHPLHMASFETMIDDLAVETVTPSGPAP